jgi:hypothetical protein
MVATVGALGLAHCCWNLYFFNDYISDIRLNSAQLGGGGRKWMVILGLQMAILEFQVPARPIHADEMKTGLPTILWLVMRKIAGLFMFPVIQ